MESGNGGASSKGVLEPVSDTSDVFQNSILAPLQSAYLYEESKQSFKYKSAVLVKNPVLEEKYDAFRAKRKEAGYSEEDLKESYGFLLFDDVNKAHALGETGVLTGNSTCTTLGDPRKGVYISMYSDCLDLNRWYHGKSGYIAIIRLTKGRVKKVVENYTQHFTAPTVEFDCHVSEQLPSVSAQTSSFLAFERTQYYMYELLGDRSNETSQSPSAACPFAIVSFSYTDTKATLVAPQETSEEEKQVCHYLPWRGQLQIGTQFYNVALKSTAGALIPAKLPPVVKVDRAISMSDLIQLLPRAVFESCFSGEVCLDGVYCSLSELISSEVEETNSLSLLLQQIKEKDLALPVALNDGGFLILLHSSYFLTYDDTGSNDAEVLQGMFVFPASRIIQRGTKSGQRKATMSSEILRILPVLSYAEGEVEKTPFDPSEEPCEVLAQHMQSYAALINPGLALSPSREVSIFPDQYDVPDAHKHLYSSPEWTKRALQSFKLYMSKPISFQLPVAKASEILAAGQEERREDLDDDVYICLSSPEEAPANPIVMGLEDQLTDQKCPVNIETSVDSCITSAEGQVYLTAVPQNVAPDDLQAGDATKDNEKSDLSVIVKTDDTGANNLPTSPTSDDLSAELIVSITSAEQTLTDESLTVISTVSATKQNDMQLSGFSAAKVQTAGANSLHDETVKIQNKDCPEVPNFTKTKGRKLCRGPSKGLEKISKASVENLSLQKVKIPGEDDISTIQKDDQAKESLVHSKLNNLSNVDWRKLPRRKRKFGKVSSRNKKVRSATVGLAEEKKSAPGQQSLEGNTLMELEVCPLRKKTERWDLKPVISECGRILVPYGSVDVAAQIFRQCLVDKSQCTKDQQHPQKMLSDVSLNTPDKVKMKEDSSTAPETEMEATASKDGGNHFHNFVASLINTEHLSLRQSNTGSLPLNQESCDHSSRNDAKDTPPSEAIKEKHTDNSSPGKCATKGEFLLSKLKSVLLRGKRKTDFLVSEGTPTDTAQNTEPCLKKGKGDSDAETSKSNNATASVQDANLGVNEVPKMQSVDPLFAYALGLTPKEKPDKAQTSEDQDSQIRKNSSETQEQTILDKRPQIMPKPPSIFPRRGRIKTLKKHQGISAEYIKKKWWLHFQTPACFTTEKLKYKECTRDNSVRKTVKEKMNSACSSTDALNLLADLALGASNDQVPPQPDPALERKPEPSLKKCGLTKDVTNAEQESVLHALLRQPAARPIHPFESPSPSHLVGESELVGLISEEHAYSLPPSSPLLLDLPGTPFQVSPLSGSTRLLHHHQQLYGDGIQTLHPSVCQEDKAECNHRTPEYLKKHIVRRRKFRHSRTFVNNGTSIQVTRQWNENYDFNRDSKFSSDSKDRAIIRALHGPWDFSIQDTTEEVRLIVHMWIGLFYSRSTARFFHMDTNFACPEESDSLGMSSEMVPAAPAQRELKANSFDAFPSVTDTQDPLISNALDLSKKANSILDQGSVILDLSMRNCSAETFTSDPQGDRKETSGSDAHADESEPLNTLKSSVGLQEHDKTMEHSTETINDVNNVRSIYENENICSPSQKAGCLKHTNMPSFKGNGSVIPPPEETASLSVQTEYVRIVSGTGDMSHGCSKDKPHMEDGIENSQITEISTDTSKSMRNKERESNKAEDEHDETESKENWEVKEIPCQQGNIEPSPKVIDTYDDSTNKESGVVRSGNCFENEKQLSREEPQAVSPSQAENVNEDVDCSTVNEGEMITGEHSFGKEDGLDEKESCISSVAVDSDLSEQPLPMMCDGPESVKKDCITDGSHQAPLDKQPPQTDNEEDACHNLQLRKPLPNSSVLTDAISEKAPNIPSEIEPVYNQPAVEDNSENDICLGDKVHDQMEALPISDESTCPLHGSCLAGSVPQTKDNLETGNQNMEMAILNFGPSSDETKSVVVKEKDDNTTQEEPFHHQVHSPQSEAEKKWEAEEALTKESDLKTVRTNEALGKSHSGVVIPFIGLDISREDIVQPHISHQQSKVEEVVQGQKEMPFISETVYSDLPIKVCSTSDMYSKKQRLTIGKTLLLHVSETNQSVVLGSESHDRCHTPTLDERPYECIPCSGPISSTSAFGSSETYQNITQKSYSRSSTPIIDEIPLEQKLSQSTVHSDHNPHYGLHPDVELRTLRVLQSIDKFFSKSNHTDKSSQIETDDMKNYLHQTPNLNSKHIPPCLASSHTSADFKDKRLSNLKPVVVSASTSHELHKESSDHFLISPFKSKLEEVLGVRLQLKKMDSPLPQHYFERTDKLQETFIGQSYCNSYTPIPSTECLQTITSNTDQDRYKTAPQSNLNHEPRSYSQRPVMAVKPSKSDESQAYCISKDGQIEYSPKNKQTQTPVVTSTTPNSIHLEKKTEHFKGNSGLNNEKQESTEFSSRCSWLSNVIDSRSKLDEDKFVLLNASNQCQGKDTKIPLSSLSMQSFESAKSEVSQGFLTCSSLDKVGQTTKENIEVDQKDCSEASTSFADRKDTSIIGDSLILGPQSSLSCTVFNTNQKRSYSFLEQVSQRCLQDDITQASMEQECLIFSEKMKQLLKRSKRGPICQQDSHDKLTLSCASPVTVHFSSLEEQEDSLELLDAPSLVGQKIKVDVSDRKGMAESTGEEKTLHPQKLSPGLGNLKEHVGVSALTAECARLYEAMMDDVCAVKKVPSRPMHFRMDKGYKKTEPSNHFDFCDQMKREMDESFRSNLNSVVKKSCKRKYRFYILMTSDDALFEETKAQLEAEGHTAVQPSEFFRGEGSSSSLLIILRNEDIAEHICEVPHLLELKKSPGVQFAGIDEPDDVVNLTHQELFMRGGFIMFDRAALEPLSVCDMKKFSEILQELSRTGKWKWMLHYRDSRRLKENARLSAEAKEKKHFLNSCQETGILEVLPYHECDLMSRDQPDYLTCLVRLQVQNISARYPIFITDTTTDICAFGRNGILTTTVNSFLTSSPSETFTI
ncbi:protein TASOR 2 isoform X2 [Trachinotus anak]|uniref:protein TASOR 2 isoform X2 n=1 Tax=Trachinotus anak TaxID=443729 RepID=UPI0039F19EA3